LTVRVRIPAPLRSVTAGEAEISVGGSSVADALGELETRFPDLRTRLRDDDGELRRFVNLYVNGEDIRFLAGLQTSLQTGDEMSIIPAVAGGSGRQGSEATHSSATAHLAAQALIRHHSGGRPADQPTSRQPRP
jgi:sulfur-carrier protein